VTVKHVLIPYREYKAGLPDPGLPAPRQFSSLIGNIKTEAGETDVDRIFDFSSLIGNIKTLSQPAPLLGFCMPKSMFSSLIGNIKPAKTWVLVGACLFVLIPYREYKAQYAKERVPNGTSFSSLIGNTK